MAVRRPIKVPTQSAIDTRLREVNRRLSATKRAIKKAGGKPTNRSIPVAQKQNRVKLNRVRDELARGNRAQRGLRIESAEAREDLRRFMEREKTPLGRIKNWFFR